MRLKAAFVVLMLIGLLIPQVAAAASAARSADSTYGREMLSLINRDRQAAGLPALHWGIKLERAALGHSIDMASHNYLSHNTLSGASPYDRMARQGLHYGWEGENIGFDQGTNGSAALQAIETAMLQSPEHRANLLRRSFTHVGIGVALIGNKIYITEDFRG